MKLKRWRIELKNLIQYELFHEHTLKEIVSDPFIYVVLYFFLSGAYVFIMLTLYFISFFL